MTPGTKGRSTPAPIVAPSPAKHRPSGPGLELVRPVAGVSSPLLTKAVRRVEARWVQLYGPTKDVGDIPRLLAAFATTPPEWSPDARRVRLRVANEAALPEVARWVVGQGLELYEMRTGRPSLEAVFLQVMGEDQRPG